MKKQPASHRFAETTLGQGTYFLHKGLVEEALEIALPDAPPQPFSEDEIRALKARGEMLIWYPAVDVKGKPITMKCLYDKFGNKAPLGGKLLFDTGLYTAEPFFITETARTGQSKKGSWRIVGTEEVPGTIGADFLNQTIIAASYVTETVYGGNPPNLLREILAWPEKRKADLAEMVSEDWKKGAEALSRLPFNLQFRDTPIEALLRVIVCQIVNRVRLLERKWSWTNSRFLRGGLVLFGFADGEGARVSGWDPRFAGGGTGFFLSRSENVGGES